MEIRERLYAHDCDQCKYEFSIGDAYDVYTCTYEGRVTVIVRHGDENYEYASAVVGSSIDEAEKGFKTLEDYEKKWHIGYCGGNHRSYQLFNFIMFRMPHVFYNMERKKGWVTARPVNYVPHLR